MLLLMWIVYFVTDVYGHVALKMASGATDLWSTLTSFWGITAVLAWLASGLAWTFVLSRNPLLTANTVSALTYVMIALAAAVIFKERVTLPNVVGMICVFVGIYLVTR